MKGRLFAVLTPTPSPLFLSLQYPPYPPATSFHFTLNNTSPVRHLERMHPFFYFRSAKLASISQSKLLPISVARMLSANHSLECSHSCFEWFLMCQNLCKIILKSVVWNAHILALKFLSQQHSFRDNVINAINMFLFVNAEQLKVWVLIAIELCPEYFQVFIFVRFSSLIKLWA